MKPTIIVGDLHGKVEIAMQVLGLWPHYDAVFIGDYLDSFDRSVNDQVMTLMHVLNAAEEGKAIALWGNHELSYVDIKHRCSGYNGATAAHVIHLQNRMYKTLVDYTWVGDFLVTHAGISKVVMRKLGLPDTLEGVDQALETDGWKHNIGGTRGGRGVGGIFWCDWGEEFQPLESVPQIVGHSSARPISQKDRTEQWPHVPERDNIIMKGNSYNIDCLDNTESYVLLIHEDGRAEEINLNDGEWF
jgi:hypothetical protein